MDQEHCREIYIQDIKYCFLLSSEGEKERGGKGNKEKEIEIERK